MNPIKEQAYKLTNDDGRRYLDEVVPNIKPWAIVPWSDSYFYLAVGNTENPTLLSLPTADAVPTNNIKGAFQYLRGEAQHVVLLEVKRLTGKLDAPLDYKIGCSTCQVNKLIYTEALSFFRENGVSVKML